ncbi:MAG: hypothetical protein ACI9Y7_002839, partial [Dokdonia sp.]
LKKYLSPLRELYSGGINHTPQSLRALRQT